MARFTVPRDIYFGKGALNELKTLKGKKAILVIGGGSIKRSGALEKIEGCLKEAGMDIELIEGVENDPTVDTVLKGAERMRAFEPDWIIGIGGGSPIDAAKAMWIFYENPDFTFEEAAQPFNLPTLRKKAQFAAVTTTSGTGTEVTSFSVITDNKTGIKYPIADFNITPDVAIVDTDLARTMPKQLIAHTGMDAITHAFEAYVSTARNEFTDALAIKAIEMIKESLIPSFEGDMTSRDQMHIAQCLAGMSFSNAILGIVHSMAHKTGKIFKIPHGCANAIYLPFVIEFNKKEAMPQYADIARRLGLKGDTDAELVEVLTDMIRTINEALEIPSTLKAYGVEKELFYDSVKEIAKNAVADPCTGTNPRTITCEEMEALLTCIYEGKRVDF